MAKPTKWREVVVKTGERTDPNTGKKKGIYKNCGTIFYNEEWDSYSMRLEMMPVSENWNGWFSLFKPRSPGGNVSFKQRQPSPGDDFDDDIPF